MRFVITACVAALIVVLMLAALRVAELEHQVGAAYQRIMDLESMHGYGGSCGINEGERVLGALVQGELVCVVLDPRDVVVRGPGRSSQKLKPKRSSF